MLFPSPGGACGSPARDTEAYPETSVEPRSNRLASENRRSIFNLL
jgi:hypothetical protein